MANVKKPGAIRSRRRRGMVLVYLSIVITVCFALCSLAVDMGRVWVVKTELQRTADAAARYGVSGLLISAATAQSYATASAAENLADGSPVVLNAQQDIEFGTWDYTTRTFTLVSSGNSNSATAIRVWCRRTSARGTAVPTLFARVLGFASCDVHASAIASYVPIKYGVVGLDYINMGGNATTAYWSSNGSSAGNFGNIGSNGDITLSGSTQINGNALPGIGKQVIGVSHVTGSTTPVTTALVYPPEDPSPYTSANNDNASVPNNVMVSGSLQVGSNKSPTIPGGHYYFNNVSISGTVTFTGPATIYFTGSFSMGGHAYTSGNTPANLRIVGVGASPGTINIGSGSDVFAQIYSPLSPITMGGNGDIWGSVVGKSIDMIGTSGIHYDLSLDANAGKVNLVK